MKKILFLCLYMAGFGLTFTTNFDGTENPISENNAWHHAGLDWHYVRTSGGIAYGTQTAGGYSDSYALLSGFKADQTASGVVHVVRPIPDDGHTHELEMLLRWTDSTHSAKGYECLFDQGGGVQLVRWNGALGDFTVLNPVSYGYRGPIQNGDTLKASVVGSVITMYINSIKMAQLTDNSYATGQPGMGFCCGTLATNDYYALTAFTATDNGNTEAEAAADCADFSLYCSSSNPATLRYAIPSNGPVTLAVYDITGRRMATLVDENKASGSHTAGFNGRALSAGVCIARLVFGDRIQARKIVVLK